MARTCKRARFVDAHLISDDARALHVYAQIMQKQDWIIRPHRLVVRTSRCGRDNPGSTPGVVNLCRAQILSLLSTMANVKHDRNVPVLDVVSHK